MKNCPICNELIDESSVMCPICGEETGFEHSENTENGLCRCPVCDELIDETAEVCPICCEPTGFQPKIIEEQSPVIEPQPAVVEPPQPVIVEPQPVIEPVVERQPEAPTPQVERIRQKREERPRAMVEIDDYEEHKKGKRKRTLRIALLSVLAAIVLAAAGVGYYCYNEGLWIFDKTIVNTSENGKQPNKELTDELNEKMTIAKSKETQGLAKSDENYEDYLIEAMTQYKEIEKQINNNSDLNIEMAELQPSISFVRNALREAIAELSKEAYQLQELDEDEIAQEYFDRVKKMETFLDSIE